MLLRVGIDRGTGGALGPIFPDGTFEYVPVPEAVPTRLGLTYATVPGRHVGSLAAVLPARLAARRPHLDPDFAAATYGDTAAGKRRQLLRLSGGDRLIFYAGLAPSPPEDRPRLFAIGELEVRRVHDLKSADFARADLRAKFGGTAHFLRLVPDEALALVEGVPSTAKLFDRAVPLGDAQDRALPELARVGYQGSLLRSVGHWIRGAESLRFLDDWLRDGPVSLICADSRLFSLDAAAIDSWPAGELALDGERMREGDWFVALGGRGASSGRQGVEVQLNSPVVAIEKTNRGFVVTCGRDAAQVKIEAEAVVHGAGRIPDLEDLDVRAGDLELEHDGRHLRLTPELQSRSNPAVYAAGDAAEAAPMLTPVAELEGEIVAHNLLHPDQRKPPDYSGIPSAVFTIPVLASVGLTEEQAAQKGLAFDVHQADITSWYSARRLRADTAAYKILVGKTDHKIVGAHLIGPGAEETINLFALAIRSGIDAAQMQHFVPAYPSEASNIGYMLA